MAVCLIDFYSSLCQKLQHFSTSTARNTEYLAIYREVYLKLSHPHCKSCLMEKFSCLQVYKFYIFMWFLQIQQKNATFNDECSLKIIQPLHKKHILHIVEHQIVMSCPIHDALRHQLLAAFLRNLSLFFVCNDLQFTDILRCMPLLPTSKVGFNAEFESAECDGHSRNLPEILLKPSFWRH